VKHTQIDALPAAVRLLGAKRLELGRLYRRRRALSRGNLRPPTRGRRFIKRGRRCGCDGGIHLAVRLLLGYTHGVKVEPEQGALGPFTEHEV